MMTQNAVAKNVAERRAHLGLSIAELSRLTKDAGHPLAALALRRIEAGERRIDVDDLTTLAAILETTPAALLSPPEPNELSAHYLEEKTSLSGAPALTPFEALTWINGALEAPTTSARTRFYEQKLSALTSDLEAITKQINEVGETTPEGFELRGVALEIEMEKSFFEQRLEALRGASPLKKG